MKRFISIVATLATVLITVPFTAVPAAQAGGSLTWTDISAQLSERNNRPIWAMAYANGSWFYTDGHDLWNGGQAYRYDGATQVNMTADLRNAGINRVDEIVSDGADTAIFLQDIVRLDDTLRIVVDKNGTLYNATNVIRGAFS